MPVGGYIFCLTVWVSTESNQDCTYVAVRPSSPPAVIVPRTIEDLNPSEMLVIQGAVCYDGRVFMEWVSQEESGISFLNY